MPTRPCCCTNDGEGHRCPQAWHLIHEAQLRLLYRDWPALKAARHRYTLHEFHAGLRSPATTVGDIYPDTCTITMADDPRCPQCSTKETP